jgi:phospholipase C
MNLSFSKSLGQNIQRASITFCAVVTLLVPGRSFGAGNPAIPFEHFVIIVQENHSFDNYFGTFPGANGIPPGVLLSKVPGGPRTLSPFLTTLAALPSDIAHIWQSAALSYDNGAMDGFYWGASYRSTFYYGKDIVVPQPDPNLVKILPNKGAAVPSHRASDDGEVRSVNGFTDDEDDTVSGVEDANQSAAAKTSSSGPPKQPPWSKYALCYYDEQTIPNYWEYAMKYTLCDNFFSALRGPSQPNHLYSMAAQSGGLVYDVRRPEIAVYSFPTMVDLLKQAGLTWKYYTGFTPHRETFRNPLPGFSQYKNDKYVHNRLVEISEFHNDLANGTLPQISWIIPGADNSEHPPDDITVGMWYVTGLVNAIMKSAYWSNTCIIIFWDDYGGFYEHVPPTNVDEYGLGFRVPCLLISPYSLAGTVVHTQYDITSPLKLIETKFLLTSLTNRDSASNTMLECFDFNQSPLPPVIITRKTKLDFSTLHRSK